MPSTLREPPRTTRKKKKSRPAFAWGRFFLTAATIAVAVYYLCFLGPTLVPVPEGVKVPFPAATEFLEQVVVWCGAHSQELMIAGGILLIPGLIFRGDWGRGYYSWLILVLGLSVGFTYLSISAPIDRLMHNVENNIPQREIPMPGR